jgi:hypothetical protein
MNIYRHQFIVACPANSKPIIYDLEIRSERMIYVEKIVIACALWKSEYHERMADHLAQQFPGTHQVLKAHHHGVDVETIRCAESSGVVQKERA